MKTASYVQITRKDFETWLNQAPWPWKRDPRYKGIYLIELSRTVGISVRSTVGGEDTAMSKGKASGAMRLVSLVHGHTLNGKAQGQSHFARTKNWRENWKKGVNRVVEAYDRSPAFYDAFARVKDRDKYKKEIMGRIEAKSGWQGDDTLSSFYDRVKGGGILVEDQMSELTKALKSKNPGEGGGADGRLEDLRKLWVAAKRDNNSWLMDFTKSIADQLRRGRSLSQKQKDVVRRNMANYQIGGESRIKAEPAKKREKEKEKVFPPHPYRGVYDRVIKALLVRGMVFKDMGGWAKPVKTDDWESVTLVQAKSGIQFVVQVQMDERGLYLNVIRRDHSSSGHGEIQYRLPEKLTVRGVLQTIDKLHQKPMTPSQSVGGQVNRPYGRST